MNTKEDKKEYDRKNYIKKREIYLKRSQKYREEHSEYIKKYYEEYYQKNRNKILELCKQYRKTENGKATEQRREFKERTVIKENINTLTAEEWIKILKDYKFKCAYCGKEFNLFDRPERDHVVPISKGGNNIKENIVPSCRSCNSKKYNKILFKRGGKNIETKMGK